MNIATCKVDKIIWREDLYPRFEPIPARIQQYAECIELLPPIEINQRNELIDGYHRWIAHKKAKLDTIRVVVTETKSDIELDRLMAKRNADFGIQLSREEKGRKARQWFVNLDTDKQQIADDLAVPLRTVRAWLSRKTKDLKEEQKKDAIDKWLACYTEDEIADSAGVTRQSINSWVEKSQVLASLPKLTIFSNYQDQDWKPPLYNVWKRQAKTNKTSGTFFVAISV